MWGDDALVKQEINSLCVCCEKRSFISFYVFVFVFVVTAAELIVLFNNIHNSWQMYSALKGMKTILYFIFFVCVRKCWIQISLFYIPESNNTNVCAFAFFYIVCYWLYRATNRAVIYFLWKKCFELTNIDITATLHNI